MKVTLYAASGSSEQTVTMSQDDIRTGSVTFANVRTPQRVAVSVNGGTDDALTIDAINTAKLAAPLYAESAAFILDNKTGNYTITVTPEPRYARLELSGISHDTNHGTGNSCILKPLTLRVCSLIMYG